MYLCFAMTCSALAQEFHAFVGFWQQMTCWTRCPPCLFFSSDDVLSCQFRTVITIIFTATITISSPRSTWSSFCICVPMYRLTYILIISPQPWQSIVQPLTTHRTSLPFPLHCGESLNQGLHREDVAKWFVATSSHGCLQLVDLLFSIWVGPFTSALCHCPDDWYCQRYGWSTSLVLEVWLHICPIWSIFWFAFWQCYKSCA